MHNWVYKIPFDLVTKAAQGKNVEPALVAAIVSVESSGNTWAARFEPHYRYLVRPDEFAIDNMITSQTEVMFQKTSLGPMQVMGGVARELGHSGHLSELFDPEVGIGYGVQKLDELMTEHHNMLDAVSAYNQGSPRKNSMGDYRNQPYVDLVMERYRQLKGVENGTAF